MYKPEIAAYKGNQVLISSGRVVAHSSTDSVFLFGKKAVAISSPGTVNIDASDSLIISTPTIQLGLGASHPVIRGDEFLFQLNRLLAPLSALALALVELSSDPEDLSAALPLIQYQAKIVGDVASNLNSFLTTTLSTTTYTV